MKIIISNDVKEDIIEIYNYIAKDSLKYAKETVNNIYSCITKLETSPYIGRYIPEFLDKQYRELLYKSYRIVYDISEENIIYVHFIVYEKRSFKSFYKSYIKNNF